MNFIYNQNELSITGDSIRDIKLCLIKLGKVNLSLS